MTYSSFIYNCQRRNYRGKRIYDRRCNQTARVLVLFFFILLVLLLFPPPLLIAHFFLSLLSYQRPYIFTPQRQERKTIQPLLRPDSFDSYESVQFIGAHGLEPVNSLWRGLPFTFHRLSRTQFPWSERNKYRPSAPFFDRQFALTREQKISAFVYAIDQLLSENNFNRAVKSTLIVGELLVHFQNKFWNRQEVCLKC